MLKSKKIESVKELEEIYSNSKSVVITHYHGLTVSDITVLRRSLRECGASFKVVKNTLVNIANKNIGIQNDESMYTGPTAIAYSEDEVSAAKGVVDFAKSNDNLKIIGGVVNQSIVNVVDVKQLAALPSIDELRGKLVGLLQAPAGKLARIVQTPASSLAQVFKAYAVNK